MKKLQEGGRELVVPGTQVARVGHFREDVSTRLADSPHFIHTQLQKEWQL